MKARQVFPVVYQPASTVIGSAATAKGAMAVAARVVGGLLTCERWSATLADRMIEPDDPKGDVQWVRSWFVGPTLAGTRGNRQ